MITTNALDQTTDTQATAHDTADTVATIALDQVNGGWRPSPYAYASPYGYASPYASRYGYASPYGNPYMAAARYEAHLQRRAVRMESRAARWWGY